MTRTRSIRKCPWCGRNDPRVDHNYRCGSCGTEVKAHWSSVATRVTIERYLHKKCLCPKCAVEKGLIKSVKEGMTFRYEQIGQPSVKT